MTLTKIAVQHQRLTVVQEAVSWVWTPFHWYAKVKGTEGGCDCGSLLQACFEKLGPVQLPRYTTQFFLHGTEEVYLKALAQYCYVGGHSFQAKGWTKKPCAAHPERFQLECTDCQRMPSEPFPAECVICGIEKAGHISIQTPGPGDIVCFKMGKAYGHAGVVIQWPVIVHSCARDGYVSKVHADSHPELSGRDRLFFSWKAWHDQTP